MAMIAGCEQELTAMLSTTSRDDAWRPPILKTVATTGEGVAQLRQALDRFRTFGAESALKVKRQREHCRARLLELLRQRLFEKVVAERLRDGSLDRHVEEILERRRDPHSVVEELVEKWKVKS